MNAKTLGPGPTTWYEPKDEFEEVLMWEEYGHKGRLERLQYLLGLDGLEGMYYTAEDWVNILERFGYIK